jgi:hypothetical protein
MTVTVKPSTIDQPDTQPQRKRPLTSQSAAPWIPKINPLTSENCSTEVQLDAGLSNKSQGVSLTLARRKVFETVGTVPGALKVR